ncbi:MAG: steroid-22-oyl-CoA synthetase, partial [Actinomycetota bacterium]
VRVVDHMPLTDTNKIVKTRLRAEAWVTDDAVYWRAERGNPNFTLMTDADRAALHAEFDAHGRGGLVPNP